MKRQSPDDIRIGADEWIPFADITGGRDKARSIDELVEPLWPFFELVELHCVAGCCGLNAFDFSPQAITGAVRQLDRAGLRKKLTAVIDAVDRLPDEVLVSHRLNNFVHRATLLTLLRHMNGVIDAG